MSLRPVLVIRWPRAVLALLLSVSLAATAALVRLDPPGLDLEIDPSTELLLPSGDPAYDVYRKAILDFGDDEVFVVAMECDEVFAYPSLAALRRVSDRISRIEGVRTVKSLVEVTSFRFVPEQGWIEVRPFIEEIPTEPAALAALRVRALASPLYRQTLVSADGKTAALNVSFREMTDREFIAADLDGRIRAILDEETTESRHFYVSGRPHVKSVMYFAMIRDLRVLIPLAVAVMAVILALAGGTLRGVLVSLGTVAVGVLWTFGAMALLGRPLTVLTVLLAPTLVAIGSVYGVHILARYQEERAAGGDAVAAVRRCLDHVIAPVLIAGLTTAVGFAALLVTEVPAVFELGAFSVLGIASITLISLTGVPAALVLRSGSPASRPGGRGGLAAPARRLGAALDAALGGLARATRRRPSRVIFFWLLLTALSAASIPRIAIDTDYLSYFDERAPVRREFEQINRLLAGAVPLFVVLEGPVAGFLRDPEVLESIQAVQRRIDAIPGVSRTLSLLDSLRVLNRAIEGDDTAEERIPDTRAAVSELLFLMPKSDLQRFATVDHSGANLIVRTGEVGSAAVRALAERIEAVLEDGGLPEGLRAEVTGNAILLSRAADGVARSQSLTVGLAAVTIFALLAAGLRSVRLGLVAMVPNVVPVLVFFGVLGLGAAPLSLPTSLIGSVALGIAIDATAHYLVRYRAERRAGCDPSEAVLRCGRRIGRPVAIASVMLILGFLSVAASELATLREFGVLSAFTMVVCFLADMVLLPAILVRARI